MRSLRVDRADRGAATVRNASRMARRMASSRANVNDIFASFLPVCDIGEGQVTPMQYVPGPPTFATVTFPLSWSIVPSAWTCAHASCAYAFD
jgi:hypothetical protein